MRFVPSSCRQLNLFSNELYDELHQERRRADLLGLPLVIAAIVCGGQSGRTSASTSTDRLVSFPSRLRELEPCLRHSQQDGRAIGKLYRSLR
jgi:hypothetical protein